MLGTCVSESMADEIEDSQRGNKRDSRRRRRVRSDAVPERKTFHGHRTRVDRHAVWAASRSSGHKRKTPSVRQGAGCAVDPREHNGAGVHERVTRERPCCMHQCQARRCPPSPGSAWVLRPRWCKSPDGRSWYAINTTCSVCLDPRAYSSCLLLASSRPLSA